MDVSVLAPGPNDRLYASRSLLSFTTPQNTWSSSQVPGPSRQRTPRRPADLQAALAKALTRAQDEPAEIEQQIRALSRATALLSACLVEAREHAVKVHQTLDTRRKLSAHPGPSSSVLPLRTSRDNTTSLVDQHALKALERSRESVWVADKRKDTLEHEVCVVQTALTSLRSGEVPQVPLLPQSPSGYETRRALARVPFVPLLSPRRRPPRSSTLSRQTRNAPTARKSTLLPNLPRRPTRKPVPMDPPPIPRTGFTHPSRAPSLSLGRFLAPVPNTVLNPLSALSALERKHGFATVHAPLQVRRRSSILASPSAQAQLQSVAVPSYAFDLLDDFGGPSAPLDLGLKVPSPPPPAPAPRLELKIASPPSTPQRNHTTEKHSPTKLPRPSLADQRRGSSTLPRQSTSNGNGNNTATSPGPAVRKRLSAIFRDSPRPLSIVSPTAVGGAGPGKTSRPPSPVKAAVAIFEGRATQIKEEDENKKGGFTSRLKRLSKFGRS